MATQAEMQIVFDEMLKEATYWNETRGEDGYEIEFGVRSDFAVCHFRTGNFFLGHKPNGINRYTEDMVYCRAKLDYSPADIQRALQHIKPNKPTEEPADA